MRVLWEVCHSFQFLPSFCSLPPESPSGSVIKALDVVSRLMVRLFPLSLPLSLLIWHFILLVVKSPWLALMKQSGPPVSPTAQTRMSLDWSSSQTRMSLDPSSSHPHSLYRSHSSRPRIPQPDHFFWVPIPPTRILLSFFPEPDPLVVGEWGRGCEMRIMKAW